MLTAVDPTDDSVTARAGWRRAVIRKPLATSFGTSVVIQTVNIFTGVLLARMLGPQARGELAAILLWPGILVAVGSLGAIDAAAYYGARRSVDRSRLVGATLLIGLVQSIVLVAIGAAIIPFVFDSYRDSTVRIAYFMLAYIPLNMIALYLMWLLNGFQRFAWFQALRLTTIVVAAVVIVGLALGNQLSVLLASLAYLVANIATLVAAAVLVRAESGLSLRFDMPLSRKILGFGVRSHVSNVSSALNERLDQLLIAVFLSPAQLGLYVIAVTLSSATYLVGLSVYLVALSAVAGIESAKAQAVAARRFIALTVAISTAFSIPIVLFAPNLIRLFFGTAFLPAADVCRVLVIAAIAFSTSRALGAILKAIGRPLDPGIGELIALIATLLGLAILLPLFGLMGAAVASLVSYATSTIWMMHRVMRALGLSAGELLLPDRTDLQRAGRFLGLASRSRDGI